MDKLERIKELIFTLNTASKSYYNDNKEIMTNKEYDDLFDELKQLETKTGIIYNNSPTQNVGYEVQSKLEKVKHSSKMLSLDKTKDIDRLSKWLGDKQGILSWKLDGLTVVLTYENGELKRAVTRGNGEIGEDVTHNIKTCANVPLKIQKRNRLVIRGEAILSYSDFYRINSELSSEEKYKNPRNLCSGTVRQLNSEVCANREVRFVAFELLEGSKFSRVEDNLDLLKYNGFEVVDYAIVNNHLNFNHVINAYTETAKYYDYPVDGLVLTYNNIDYGKSLGLTSHHPKHSLVLKWADESQTTTLRDVLVDVGKNGQISYTGVFDPVDIEGTTVTKATLHNYDYIKELELGIGDTVEVIKANMIIPQIIKNHTCSNTYEKVLACPVCGSELEHKGVHQFCTNYNCDKQVIARLVHWCSRDAMNIEGMSEETIKTIRKIRRNDGISALESVADIYAIPKNKDVLLTLDRFGQRKVDKLCNAIEKSKTMPLSNVIYGLVIPQVGRKASKLLAEKYKDIREFIKYHNTKGSKIGLRLDIQKLVGESVGNSFINNFYDDKIIVAVELLNSYGLTMTQSQEEKLNTLQDKIFVVTGSINHFKNRKELQSKIESLGGKVSGSVSKNTNYLINNDKESNSSKNKKAKELGVTIINEEEFIEMIRD